MCFVRFRVRRGFSTTWSQKTIKKTILEVVRIWKKELMPTLRPWWANKCFYILFWLFFIIAPSAHFLSGKRLATSDQFCFWCDFHAYKSRPCLFLKMLMNFLSVSWQFKMFDIKNGKVFLEDMCKWVQSFSKSILKNGHRLLVDGVWRSFTADSLVHFFFEQLFQPKLLSWNWIFSCRFCPVEENFLCQFDEVSLRLYYYASQPFFIFSLYFQFDEQEFEEIFSHYDQVNQTKFTASYSRNLQNSNNTELRNSFHEGTELRIIETHIIGVARIFQRGGHSVSKWGYSPECHVDSKKFLKKRLFNYGQDIVTAFSPPVAGFLVKKGLQKGGHGHPRTPLATPLTHIQQTNLFRHNIIKNFRPFESLAFFNSLN